MIQRILVVEDEENMMEVIKTNLEIEGYEVVTAATGDMAVKKFKEGRFNLVLLDIMLPNMNGYQVCESIRSKNIETPILFLTAKDTSEDKIIGLKMGADDYLTKPFNLEELLLRVKILIRHSLKGTKNEKQNHTVKFGTNEINFSTLTAKTNSGKKSIELTKREAALLKLLIDRKDHVISRQEILTTVWGYDVFPTTRTIDNFILTFRKYFEKNPRSPVHFHSIRGVGYKFIEQ